MVWDISDVWERRMGIDRLTSIENYLRLDNYQCNILCKIKGL